MHACQPASCRRENAIRRVKYPTAVKESAKEPASDRPLQIHVKWYLYVKENKRATHMIQDAYFPSWNRILSGKHAFFSLPKNNPPIASLPKTAAERRHLEARTKTTTHARRMYCMNHKCTIHSSLGHPFSARVLYSSIIQRRIPRTYLVRLRTAVVPVAHDLSVSIMLTGFTCFFQHFPTRSTPYSSISMPLWTNKNADPSNSSKNYIYY